MSFLVTAPLFLFLLWNLNYIDFHIEGAHSPCPAHLLWKDPGEGQSLIKKKKKKEREVVTVTTGQKKL